MFKLSQISLSGAPSSWFQCPFYMPWLFFKTYELFISEIFYLIFLDCGWLWVTKTTESENADGGQGTTVLYISQTEEQRSCQPGNTNGHRQKKCPKKNPALYSQRTRNGAVYQDKNRFYIITTYSKQTPWKHHGSTLTPSTKGQMLRGEPRLPSLTGCNELLPPMVSVGTTGFPFPLRETRHPPPPWQGSDREGGVERQGSPHFLWVTNSSPPWCQWRPHGAVTMQSTHPGQRVTGED